MSIKAIQIKNITVFEDITIEFCKGVNVIIGKNGTGKTQLLKILYAMYNSEKLNNKSDNSSMKFEVQEEVSGYSSIDLSLLKTFGIKSFQNIIRDNGKLEETQVILNFNEKSYPGYDKSCVFIPAKEMLSHSKGLLAMAKKYGSNMPFDKTLIDIVEKAQAWKLNEIPLIAVDIFPVLEDIIDGEIFMKDDGTFFIRKRSGLEIEFSLEAEGLRKFALLMQLLLNESITKDTILLWDEAEANVNPELIPALVDILLKLQRSGVQIFVATHDYNFAKYFELKRRKGDNLVFHSLYKEDKGVKAAIALNYRDIEANPIERAFETLHNDIIDKAMEEITDE